MKYLLIIALLFSCTKEEKKEEVKEVKEIIKVEKVKLAWGNEERTKLLMKALNLGVVMIVRLGLLQIYIKIV